MGGGTPSVIPLEVMKPFLRNLFRRIEMVSNAEKTIEINPSHATVEYVYMLKEAGFTRFSFGVQSFNDNKLATLGRIHTTSDLDRLFRITTALTNWSVDLMFGLSVDSILLPHEIDSLLALRPPHISLYNLKIEPGTPFEAAHKKQLITLADDDTQAEYYSYIHTRLTEAGYRHYETSNFCIPGYESQHNLKYWKMTPWHAFGPSATSFDGSKTCTHAHSIEDFIKGIHNDTVEILHEKDLRRDTIMMGLRTDEGVILSPEEHQRCSNNERLDGLIYLKDNSLIIPHEHWFRANSIIVEVLDTLNL